MIFHYLFTFVIVLLIFLGLWKFVISKFFINDDISLLEKKIAELNAKKRKLATLKEEIDVTEKLNFLDKELEKLTEQLNQKQKELENE